MEINKKVVKAVSTTYKIYGIWIITSNAFRIFLSIFILYSIKAEGGAG